MINEKINFSVRCLAAEQRLRLGPEQTTRRAAETGSATGARDEPDCSRTDASRRETNFFLRLADQLQLADKQRAALEEIAYEYQKYSVQRLADRDVADAELQRLLTRDNIDLDAVRAKVREAEAITTDVKIRMIEAVLKAVTTLTHEQHLKAITLIQELQTPKERPPAGRISE